MLLVVRQLPINANAAATAGVERESTSDEVVITRLLGQLEGDAARLDAIVAVIDRRSQLGGSGDLLEVDRLLQQAQSLLDEINQITEEIASVVANLNDSDSTGNSLQGNLHATALNDDSSTSVNEEAAGPQLTSVSNGGLLQLAAFGGFSLGHILSGISSTLNSVTKILNRVSTELKSAAGRLPQPLKEVAIVVVGAVTKTLNKIITVIGKVGVKLLGGCGSSLSCGPPCTGLDTVPTDSAATLRSKADAIMNMCNNDFLEFKRTRHPAPFNWEDDGCSGPIWKNYTLYNDLFNGPCQQHDFAYRNYGASDGLGLGRDEVTRAWLDRRLFEEMNRVCSEKYKTVVQVPQRAACLAAAQQIYSLVRTFGARFFHNAANFTPPTTTTTLAPHPGPSAPPPSSTTTTVPPTTSTTTSSTTTTLPPTTSTTSTTTTLPRDTSPPQLVSLSIEPSVIDVTTNVGGAAAITITVRITDDASGFRNGQIQFTSPSGEQIVATGFFAGNRISGTDLDGVYQERMWVPPLTIPSFVPERGTWTVSFLSVIDKASPVNQRVYTANELATAGLPNSFENRCLFVCPAPSALSSPSNETLTTITSQTWRTQEDA